MHCWLNSLALIVIVVIAAIPYPRKDYSRSFFFRLNTWHPLRHDELICIRPDLNPDGILSRGGFAEQCR
jgi:hypothetical protein